MACQCRLTIEELTQNRLVGAGGVCTAVWADGSGNVCGRPLGSHPHTRATVVGWKPARATEINVKLGIGSRGHFHNIVVVPDTGYTGTLCINHRLARKLGFRVRLRSMSHILLGDGRMEEIEYTCSPIGRVVVLDDDNHAVTDPVQMAIASFSGTENLLGMLGLEMLKLDINAESKTLVPTLPAKKRHLPLSATPLAPAKKKIEVPFTIV